VHSHTTKCHFFIAAAVAVLLALAGDVWTDVDAARTGNLPFVFELDMSFEKYVDYAMDVPMYFVYRKGQYINALGQSWRDFMEVRSSQWEVWELHGVNVDSWGVRSAVSDLLLCLCAHMALLLVQWCGRRVAYILRCVVPPTSLYIVAVLTAAAAARASCLRCLESVPRWETGRTTSPQSSQR
jgi:hypothetical protein